MLEFDIAYMECALWSTTELEHMNISDISEETKAAMIADCAMFREKAGNLLADWDDAQAGHDFWLTRCGHGAGFWDRDTGTPEIRRELTNICQEFGNIDLYIGDDWKVYA